MEIRQSFQTTIQMAFKSSDL